MVLLHQAALSTPDLMSWTISLAFTVRCAISDSAGVALENNGARREDAMVPLLGARPWVP